MKSLKTLLKYTLLCISFYFIYTIFYNLFVPPVSGIVTLEEVANYYLPRQIEIFNRQRQKIAEIILDELGNQTKITGQVPTGSISVYYRLAQNNKKFMDAGIQNNKLSGPAKIYYPSGKIWVEANYKSGKLDGQVKEYYTPIKTLKRSSDFVDGSREGQEKKYYISGKKYTAANYQKNKLSGPYEVFYEKGQLMEESRYQAGQKTGQSKTYYPSGKIYAVTNYQNGSLTGGYTTYYETGQIKEQGQARDLPKNKHISFYSDLVPPTIEQDNGQMLRLPEKNIEIKNPPVPKEPKNITKESAPLNIGQKSENKYINNSFQEVEIQTKTQTTDLPLQNDSRPAMAQKDRVIKESSVSFADEPSSPEVVLDSTAQSKQYQKNDLPVDRVIRNNGNGDSLPDNSGSTKIKKYYPNGKLYAELPYLNGVVDGKAKFYFENERLKAEINFRHNRKEGLAKTYFLNGRIESETLFMDDAPVNKKIYNEQGQLIYSW